MSTKIYKLEQPRIGEGYATVGYFTSRKSAETIGRSGFQNCNGTGGSTGMITEIFLFDTVNDFCEGFPACAPLVDKMLEWEMDKATALAKLTRRDLEVLGLQEKK